MYEQSPEFLKKFRKNFKFFILNTEPDTSQLPLNTNFAFATHSIHNEYCAQLLDDAPPHIHVLIEVTNDCVNVVNKMTSTSFVVPCLLSSFKHLILGCSKFHLSGPLMEKLKIAVNYNNSLTTQLTLVVLLYEGDCHKFALLHKLDSIPTQTDLITNVTIERFINILNGDNAAEFSKIIDFILSGYDRLEINSNTLFVKFIMEKKFNF